MEIKINFHAEIEAKTVEQIQFICKEFDYLFESKIQYTAKDRKIAADLINYLARIIDSPTAINQLSNILEDLEAKYPNLF